VRDGRRVDQTLAATPPKKGKQDDADELVKKCHRAPVNGFIRPDFNRKISAFSFLQNAAANGNCVDLRLNWTLQHARVEAMTHRDCYERDQVIVHNIQLVSC
jgi:hypothetical protein